MPSWYAQKTWSPLGTCLLSTVMLLSIGGCSGSSSPPSQPKTRIPAPKVLSAFGLFEGAPIDMRPAAGVIPYDLNSPLFSDYTAKYRYVKLPAGQSARYDAENVFEFPVGTIIAKTFTMPTDLRNPAAGQRLLETRVLVHESAGWKAYPYIWNNEQTEATLAVAGDVLPVSWIHSDGKERTNNYLVPNVNQCKGCHKNGERIVPIGPRARHLNKPYSYPDGTTENQLTHWKNLGILTDTPDDPQQAPRLVAWDNPEDGTVEQRARAWLEINCAHCHQPGGPARNSGLDLTASQQIPVKYGVFKTPVAAGRGSGGLSYSIVPGQPNKSILVYRISSVHPEIMMPELGKRLIHDEGVALIRQWIQEMPKDLGK